MDWRRGVLAAPKYDNDEYVRVVEWVAERDEYGVVGRVNCSAIALSVRP